MKSAWFWIFLLICVVEEVTFFMPFLSFFLLAAAFFPKVALSYAKTFVKFYNEVNGTNVQIVGLPDDGKGIDSTTSGKADE